MYNQEYLTPEIRKTVAFLCRIMMNVRLTRFSEVILHLVESEEQRTGVNL